MNHNIYNKDSIQRMDPLTFCRHRPDVYCGSTADSTQLVTEIVSNAVDEHLAGNCNKISVTIDKEKNIVTVRDWGQGILPNNKQGDKTTLELVYGEVNSSGKFNKDEDAVYKVSTGAFGIGAALTCYLSHYLIATTKRDGIFEKVFFNEGKFTHRESGKCDKNEHGVIVEFQPSEEFFDSATPNESLLLENAHKITCVCPNLTYIFNGKEITHPDGLNDYLEYETKDKVEILSSRFILDETKDYRRLNLGLTVSDNGGGIIAFCNYAPIEAGTPITSVKGTITKTLNKWGQEQGLLKPKETLSGSALQEGMIIVFNLVSKDIRYDSQTKVRVTSTADNPFINEVFSNALEIWLDNNPQDGKVIIEKALLARRAAEAAKKAREAVRQKAEKKDKVFKMPTKLTDCWSKDRNKCELLVCEGDSAKSGLVAGRSSEFQAVYGVRGKILNVLKAASNAIMKNQEINNLVVALGLDYNPQTGKMVYDKDKLRYGKIIACCDADFDGFAIENLLFNVLWNLCPELIINGHVYSAVPPLYKITTTKNEYVYLKDDNALQSYKAKHKNIQSINRLKGLGEMDSSELSECLLDSDTRHIVQLTVNDVPTTNQLFQDLYGKAVEPRVKFILEHSEEARID